MSGRDLDAQGASRADVERLRDEGRVAGGGGERQAVAESQPAVVLPRRLGVDAGGFEELVASRRQRFAERRRTVVRPTDHP